MPSVHTLKKITSTIIALILLACVADASIFRRADIAKHLQAVGARISPKFFELSVALLTGLALFGLFIIFRWLIVEVASFARYLWAPAQSYDGLKSEE